jgi:hypothetical protein
MESPLERVYQFIVGHYDLEELRTLCFGLGVNYDTLRGEGTAAKARELLLYLGRRRQLDALLERLRADRPEAFAEARLSADAAALEELYAGLPAFGGGTEPPSQQVVQNSHHIAQADRGGIAIVAEHLTLGIKSPPTGKRTEKIPRLRQEIQQELRKQRELGVQDDQAPHYELQEAKVSSKICPGGVHIDYEFSINSTTPWPGALTRLGISNVQSQLEGIADWELTEKCHLRRAGVYLPLKLPFQIPYPKCNLKITIHARIIGPIDPGQKEIWSNTVIPIFLLVEYETPPVGFARKQLSLDIRVDLRREFESVAASQEARDAKEGVDPSEAEDHHG